MSSALSKALNSLKDPQYFLYSLPSQFKTPMKGIVEAVFTIYPLIDKSMGKYAQMNCGFNIFHKLVLSRSKGSTRAYEIVKSGAEMAGTYFQLKAGLFIHTILQFVENLNSLRKATSKGDLAARMVPVVSNALYLLTFAKRLEKYSSHITLASMIFEAGSNLIQAASAGKAALKAKAKKQEYALISFDALARGLIAGVRGYQAFNQFKMIRQTQAIALPALTEEKPAEQMQQEAQKTTEVSEKYFILARGGHHKEEGHHGDNLSDKGKTQMEKLGKNVGTLCKERGFEQANYVASSHLSSQASLKILAENAGLPHTEITIEPGIRERILTPAQIKPADFNKTEAELKEARKARANVSEFELFQTKPEPDHPDSESGQNMYVRMNEAINRVLASVKDSEVVTVFLAHGTSMQNYLKGLRFHSHYVGVDFTEKRYGEATAVLLKVEKNGDVTALKRFDYHTPKEAAAAVQNG